MGARRAMAVPTKKGAMKTAMKKTWVKKVVMKAPMKKKPVSKVAVGPLARHAVFSGKRSKTVGGLTKDLLTRSKTGKIVSKKQSSQAKRAFAGSKLRAWSVATKKARVLLGLKGFVPVGGKTASGKALLAKVRALVS